MQGFAFERPAWSYLVAGLVAGAFLLGVAIQIVPRPGAATLVALTALTGNLLSVLVLTLFGERTPLVATALYYVPAALALDAWHARWAKQLPGASGAVGGGLVFALVYLLVSVPLTQAVTHMVELAPVDQVPATALGLAGGVLAHWLGVSVGACLRTLSARLVVAPSAVSVA